MPVPSGVSVCNVSLNAPITFLGDAGRVHLEITPSASLVYVDSLGVGHPIGNFIATVDPTDGIAATITLPHVDQAGFLDSAGNSYTGWYYTANISYEKDGQQLNLPPRDFQVVVGQNSADLSQIVWGIAEPAHTAPIPTVTSVNGHTGMIVLSKSDVGLSNVDNTSDAAKPISTATQAALDNKAALVHRHTYSDIDGTVPTSALPPLAINETSVVASQAEMLALVAQRGDMAIRTDTGKTYVLASDSPGTLADWKEVMATGQVVSVAGRTGTVVLGKADVGLSNVDNTADTAKPVSAPQQTALDLKLNVPTGAAPTLLGLTPGYDPTISGANKLRWFTSEEQVARTLGWMIVTDPKYGASSALADNSAAINAAIADYKSKINFGANGVAVYVPGAIFFPAGVYKFTSALSAIDFRFLTMIGAGIESTVLQWDGAGPLISLGTYTSAGGYLGTASNFTMRHMQILSPAQIFLTSEGTRTGIAIQDNGSGGVTLDDVKLRGFKYGFNGAYGSDFDEFRSIHLGNCDVGMYLGPGSQQIKIDTPNVEYCREGFVLEGASQGSIKDGWFVLNSFSDVTIEGNTTSRSGVPGSGGAFDLGWSMSDCWHETNAGGLGRLAPRIVMVQGAPPNIIKHFHIIRPHIVAGGTNTGSASFLETNVTVGGFVTELTIEDLSINGGYLSYVVKNTAGLNKIAVKNVSIADGYTMPSIFSNSQQGYRYTDDYSGYVQSAVGGSYMEIRDGNNSSSRIRFLQQQDSSTSIQFWSGSAYIERLKLDTQNSRIYYNDTYLARLAANVLGVAPGSTIRTGLDTTANRPSASAMGQGSQFYDKTLDKPIWSNGTTWGTFESQDALVVNAKNYGVKGDGATDDTAAINAVLSTYKNVFFPLGTYLVSALTASVSGAVISAAAGTVFKKSAAGNLLTITATNVTVSGLTLDGNGLTGVQGNVTSTGATFDRCKFIGQGAGVDDLCVFGNPDVASNLTILRSRIEGSARVTNSDNFIADNCTIVPAAITGGYGLGVWSVTAAGKHADNPRVTNCYFEVAAGGFAFVPLSRNGAIPPRGVVVTGNTVIIKNDCYGGFSIDSCGSGVVSNNTFRIISGTPSTGAVEVVNSKNIVVSGNDFDSAGVMVTSIVLNNSADCIVAENILRNIFTRGVWINGPLTGNQSVRNLIQGNQITIASAAATLTMGIVITTNNSTAGAINNTIRANAVTGNGGALHRGVHVDSPAGTISGTTIESNIFINLDIAVRLYNDSGTIIRANVLTTVTTGLSIIAPGATGALVEGNSWQYVTAIPTTGYHVAGERAINTAPTAGAPSGWVCTVAGTPGTWAAISTVGGNPNQLTSGEAVLDRFVGGRDSTATIGSGWLLLSYFTATKSEAITKVRAATGSTAYAATPTLCRYGIYSVAADGSLTLLASTANDTTMFAAANTIYTGTLTSTFNKVAGTRYAIGVLVVTAAATGTFMGYNALSNSTANFDLGPQLCGGASGQTDLPSSLAGAQAPTTRVPQFLLLP